MSVLDRLFLLAVDLVPKLPVWLTASVFRVAAEVATTLRLAGVPQLEANYRRVLPQATPRELRRVVRRGMRSYMRYYEEAIRLPSVPVAQLSARVRVVDQFGMREHAARGEVVVGALGHLGNWDLAGAWCSSYLAPVLTVAERLRPPELFEYFLRVRRELGMTIVPAEKDGSTFRELIRLSRSGPLIVPLLADRDLSRRGVEVELFGEPARVAAGPAALALAVRAPLMPVVIAYERLHGPRRQAAGSRWGTVITFCPAVEPVAGSRQSAMQAMTQQWIDALAAGIAEHPEDWHMLQKIFVADLDARADRPRDRAGET